MNNVNQTKPRLALSPSNDNGNDGIRTRTVYRVDTRETNAGKTRDTTRNQSEGTDSTREEQGTDSETRGDDRERFDGFRQDVEPR